MGLISAASVTDWSNSKDVPNFTRGVWEKTQPFGIVT
jgi:hypothetical protein